MICEMCSQDNDSLSVKCINCGNVLIASASIIKDINKDIKKKEVKKESYEGGKIIISIIAIAGSVWIFQNYKYLFFKTDFESFNWNELFAACIWGGFAGLLGKMIGDFIYDKK